jgi:hypothetical protein
MSLRQNTIFMVIWLGIFHIQTMGKYLGAFSPLNTANLLKKELNKLAVHELVTVCHLGP